MSSSLGEEGLQSGFHSTECDPCEKSVPLEKAVPNKREEPVLTHDTYVVEPVVGTTPDRDDR